MKERLTAALRDLGASDTFRNAVVLFLARGFNSFISVVFSLLVGRLLIVEDHGLYGQILGRIAIVQAITEAGLQFSLVRFLAPAITAGDSSAVRSVIRASLYIKLYSFLLVFVFTALAMAGVYAAPTLGEWGVPAWLLPLSHPDFLVLGWFILLGGFGMSLLSYLDAILVAHGDFTRLSFWLPSVGFIRLGLLGLLLFSGEALRAEHALFVYAMGPYIAVIIYFIFFPASFFVQSAEPVSTSGWVTRLMRYNLWIVAASFMSIISDWMEILMIPRGTQAGLYIAARVPMQAFLILLATMQSILLKRFSGLTKPEEYVAVFRRIYLLILPLALLLLPGFWFFEWLIPTWYGPEYLPSTRVIFILYPNFILRLFFAPLGTALYALDQPRLLAFETGLKMVVGFVANLVLIPEYGIIGAAVASWIAQIAGWILLLYCFASFFRTGRFPLQREGEGGN